ncbi:MAG: SDR family oxidoreductase [Chloroflexota bacterium]|nr:SDR family oxidoreductase [Chloroflexota bacterium]
MLTDASRDRLVLVTGASGYVGGRLLRALVDRGHPVRCLARRPAYLRSRVPAGVDVVTGDCLDPGSLGPALDAVDVAYYLVHSMGARGDFAAQDRRAARIFGEAAHRAGIRRIVYLGGLGEDDDGARLSHHLRSRQETGDVLRESGVPVIEFRASVILGSGSLSFELIRALTERLPVMICPRWVATVAQPTAIDDVIAYLTAALDLPMDADSRIFEISGAERVSYGGIMREYARQRGLRRILISVPVLTPRLSSLWLGLVTPVYARVGRQLIEGMRNPTVVRDNTALTVFDIHPVGLAAAIRRALDHEDRAFAETRWSDSLSAAGRGVSWVDPPRGLRLVYSRTRTVPVSPDAAFAPIRRIGGTTGWYWGNWLWRLRGFVDLVVGGVGLRRGRRDPEHLCVGDSLDFWRVDQFDDGSHLRLMAEMRMPGRAWLEFEVTPGPNGGSTIGQTALFDPRGVDGLAYWYLLYPIHHLIFDRMLNALAARASIGR